MDDLTKKKCVPCEGGVPAASREKALEILDGLKEWSLSADARSIRAQYVMKNFGAAIRLVNDLARLAEDENHHPDIHLTGYRNLAIELSTHAIGGLSQNDFILAAKSASCPKI